jgi:glutamyl-tRNA reductase
MGRREGRGRLARIVSIGLSHKTAAVEQREKASLSGSSARAALRALAADPQLSECAALSTCNRTELYAVAERLGPAEDSLRRALLEHSRIDQPGLECALYVHRDSSAARHVFRVASGLDSMVLGESEIQGQVRAALELASEEGTLGPLLGRMFRQALEAGRRVRRETRVGAGATSVASVAVELAAGSRNLRGRRALLLGAGKVAEATARALLGRGLAELVVANRTATAARAVARRFGGGGVGFDRLQPELRAADAVISSTDAPHRILRHEQVAEAMASRPGRPLVLIDIAVPRDIDEAIGELPDVALYDIDDLERMVEENLNGRRQEADRAEQLVRSEVLRFQRWRRGSHAKLALGALWAHAEQVRQTELSRASARWESLSPADRDRLDALTRSLVKRLLQEPTVALRRAVEGGDGLREIESFRRLFALGDGVAAGEAGLGSAAPDGGVGAGPWRRPRER